MIPISLVNRDKSIWGEDALEFKLVVSFQNFSFLNWLSDCFFSLLGLSVGRIFRMLLHLSQEFGQT